MTKEQQAVMRIIELVMLFRDIRGEGSKETQFEICIPFAGHTLRANFEWAFEEGEHDR